MEDKSRVRDTRGGVVCAYAGTYVRKFTRAKISWEFRTRRRDVHTVLPSVSLSRVINETLSLFTAGYLSKFDGARVILFYKIASRNINRRDDSRWITETCRWKLAGKVRLNKKFSNHRYILTINCYDRSRRSMDI